MDKIIINARVATETDVFEADIGIRDGKIAAYSHHMPLEGAETIDAKGRLVVPGVIDAHTHMDFPFMGTTSADDFGSGTVAAACGGTTAIIDFILPKQSQSLLEALHDYRSRADPLVAVDYGLHMIFKQENLSELESIPQLVKEGIPSFKLFMTYRKEGLMLDDKSLFKAMQKVGQTHGLVAIHAENNGIIENLVETNLDAGNFSARYHALSKPSLAEAEAVGRAALLAHAASVRSYIVHLSSAYGAEAIEYAQSKGYDIFAETCPHYLVLTDEVYDRPDGGNFVMSPPLRSKRDCASLWDGIRSGSIQTIGSDHCPFNSQQKDYGKGDFTKIPNGVPGTETILPLMFSEGVRKNRITIFDMVRVTSSNPARRFGLYPRKGCLIIGADADLAIIDTSKRVRLAADKLHTNIDYSVYDHITTEGYPILVMSRGRTVMDNGEFVGKKGTGEFLPRELEADITFK